MPSDRCGIVESKIGPATAPCGRRRRRLAAVCLAAGAVSLPISAASAGTDNWNVSTSDWNSSSNWNPDNIPAGGDTVIINTDDANTDNIDYDYPGPAVTLSSLTINNLGGGTDVLSMQTAGLVLAGGSESIGNGGGGLMLQSAGVNSASTLKLYADGAYTLNFAGTLTVSGNEYMDFGGGFEEDGGLNALRTSFLLGSHAGSSGFYTLTNGSLGVGFAEYDGYSGTGTFAQSGGIAQVNALEVGYLGTACGAYTLGPAGALTVTTSTQIGYSGCGAFVQSGGSDTIGTSLYIAVNSSGVGSYALQGGTLTCGAEFVGDGGAGSFTESGGLNTLRSGNSLYVGYVTGSTGAYSLSDSGTLSVPASEFIGFGTTGASSGSFNQCGGCNMLVGSIGNLTLANNTGSVGTYTLGAGTVSLAGITTSEQIGSYGAGTFTQCGGLNYVNGVGESIGVYSGSVGTYNQSGGVNQMVNNFSNLSLGYNAGATGIYNLSGGTLTAGNMYVGGSPSSAGGTGALTVSGGGMLSAAGALVLYNTFSSIQVNGGSVSATVANLNGPITQTAGAISFGQIIGNGSLAISGGQTTLTSHGGASQIGSLSLNGGTLDITNNSLAINYAPAADPIATIVSYLASGFNGGNWSGVGLTSSSAAANQNVAGIGYLDSTDPGGAPNQVLVKYTLIGDTNLDGIVNFTDFATVLKNFQQTGLDWTGGNFTYNPNNPVNFYDFAEVLKNFGKSIGSLGADSLPGSGTPLGLAAQIQTTTAPLPEPGSTALAFVAAGLLSRRRRRTSRL